MTYRLARSSLEDAGYFVNDEQAGKAIETMFSFASVRLNFSSIASLAIA